MRGDGEVASVQGCEWAEATNYRVVRRIGSGGMGAVYEAVDRRTNGHVALKTVLQVDSTALYGFKQEFRTLADVRHRNLVRLHELVVSEA
ncbi:MAG: protein kinase domain-containing protein, partial [Polyangiaceae bacterium]